MNILLVTVIGVQTTILNSAGLASRRIHRNAAARAKSSPLSASNPTHSCVTTPLEARAAMLLLFEHV
jgi:hypothetical protein